MTQENDESRDGDDRSTRVRSPAYPNIGLKEVIEKVNVLYDLEGQGRHAIPITSIARRWKYASVNGSALAAVSAAKQFGLLSEVPNSDPRQLRLTDRAVTIRARSEGSPERLKAIQDAATNPKLYAGLLKEYPLPLPSDDTLREHFLINLKFNQKQIAGAIKDFKETISFAKLDVTPTLLSAVGFDFAKREEKPATDGDSPQVGDWVQWTSQGVDQFEKPRKMTWKSDDGNFVRVEGSSTGLSIAEVRRVEAANGKAAMNQQGQVNPPATEAPPMNLNFKAEPKAGMDQDTYTTNEGLVVVQWPSIMTMGKDEIEDLVSWLEIQKRKIVRSVKKNESQQN